MDEFSVKLYEQIILTCRESHSDMQTPGMKNLNNYLEQHLLFKMRKREEVERGDWW